jgi:phosphoglycolate phosphatase
VRGGNANTVFSWAGVSSLLGRSAATKQSGDGRYRLVVFDWDGTLIDSIGSIVACMRCALGEAGVPAPADEVIRGTIGLGLSDVFEHHYPSLDAAARARVREAYSRHWIETWHSRHHPFPATAAALAQVASAGMLIGLATAKSRKGLLRDLERTGLGDRFHASRTVDECPAKPHPAMLEELMAELGVRPRETLMVGDSRWDLEMARNAGTDAVAVLSGADGEPELTSWGPVACLPHVGKLPAWLGCATPPESRTRA